MRVLLAVMVSMAVAPGAVAQYYRGATLAPDQATLVREDQVSGWWRRMKLV